VEPNDLIDYLILNGALEVSGVDQNTGDFLYSFTEKLEEVSPEIFESMVESFHQEVMYLWEKGFLNIDMTTEEQSPMVSLTPKALDAVSVLELSDFEQQTLTSIIRAMKDEI
jgi:hypothetical protein